MRTFLGGTLAKFAFLVCCLEILDSSITRSVVYGLGHPDGKIFNGQEALLEETKYQVSIRKKQSDNLFFGTGHVCGGTLVSENVVLSAAHCFVDYDDVLNNGYFLDKSDFTIVMGTLNRFRRDNNTLQFDIKELILGLEKFDLNTYNFDVAILILNGSVPLGHPNISPIPLNIGEIANGTMCKISGWGTTEEGVSSSVLMDLDVPVLDNEFCAKYSNYTPGSLLPGMFCAGYTFTGFYDACFGDSGGPLACSNTLTGIVSWGFNCALPRFPGIYTDVRYYQPWIENQLSAFNLTLPTSSIPMLPSLAPVGVHFSSLLSMILLIHLIFQ